MCRQATFFLLLQLLVLLTLVCQQRPWLTVIMTAYRISSVKLKSTSLAVYHTRKRWQMMRTLEMQRSQRRLCKSGLDSGFLMPIGHQSQRPPRPPSDKRSKNSKNLCPMQTQKNPAWISGLLKAPPHHVSTAETPGIRPSGNASFRIVCRAGL